MNLRKTTAATLAVLSVLTGAAVGTGTAAAADNSVYGEVRFNTLPARGKMAHAPFPSYSTCVNLPDLSAR